MPCGRAAATSRPMRAPCSRWGGTAGAVLEVGGDRWRFAGRALNPGPILASAPGRLEAGSPHPFTLDLDLADPDLLYASYRRRMWLTAGRILSAAAGAMAGLASLWRNSRRQALGMG